MTNVVPFPNQSRAYEEAYSWIARHDRGLTTQEEAAFREWLAQDPAHWSAFEEIAALWDDMDVLSELADLCPLYPAQESTEGNRKSRGKWLRATAAGLALAVLGAVALIATGPELTKGVIGGERVFTASFETGVGERSTHQMPDGSLVTLNTGTEIRTVFTESRREVLLDRGEAHFEVASDADRPFYVHARGSLVRAVGTAFNIRLGKLDEFEITVTEGEVSVAPAIGISDNTGVGEERAADTTLVQGDVAIIETNARHVLRLRPMEMDVKLAWQRGMLIFQGESLESVLEEVGRYTTTELVIADDSLRDVRVGGYFRAGDIDDLLVALRENFQISSEFDGENRIMLRRTE